jgi:hypothetical protein
MGFASLNPSYALYYALPSNQQGSRYAGGILSQGSAAQWRGPLRVRAAVRPVAARRGRSGSHLNQVLIGFPSTMDIVS